MDLIKTYCESDSGGEDIITSSDVAMMNFDMKNYSEYDSVGNVFTSTPINPDEAWLQEEQLSIDCTPINYEYEKLQEHKVRSTYLVTYSQADVVTFDRRTFAHAVRDCFNSGKAKVIWWVCSMENHTSGGNHFHMSVLLDRLKRWKGVKNMMHELHHIVLHFSDFHTNYQTAWNYVVKEDKEYIESPNHKKMDTNCAPRTSRASAKRKENACKGQEKENKKKKKEARLTPLAFTQLIRKHNIKRMIELYAFINKEQENGNTVVPEFFYNRKINKIEELISTTWAIQDAPKTLEREKKSRLEILTAYADEKPCLCGGEWMRLAVQTLANNGVTRQHFSSAVMKLLQFGRKKGNNILIKGEASCGKSFLFYPLKKIFNCFCNPPTGTFNWLGVGDSEVIFLNDFRWSPGVIPWEQLLQLLEGDDVTFPTPKNHCKNNILFNKDCPIFATSSDEIVSNRIGSLMIKETKMMRKRWKVYSFTYEIPDDEVNEDIKPCGACFCNLLMNEEELFN